ncbi:MAG: hypothetical protein QM706_02285 [Nitrospira sp.]
MSATATVLKEHRQLSGFNLRQVKHIIDQPQEGSMSAMMNNAGFFHLLIREIALFIGGQ